MPPAISELRTAISDLHHYLMKKHWNGRALEGPDSGVRWNFKIHRFLKSYLDFLPWKDRYIFLQTQGYWILGNWLLAKHFDDGPHTELARACAEYVASSQHPEGYWNYPPVPSRIGKVATVEGDFAAIGLAESYRHTHDERLLAAAGKWNDFLCRKIGYQEVEGTLAVNYWAGSRHDLPVPNNATLTLWALAELADASGKEKFLLRCRGLVDFLRRAQLESGELPYSVAANGRGGRPHFLCFQYNAFECLDLVYYYRLTGDAGVLPIVERLAAFLATGVLESGAARYSCTRDKPEVPYYTAALATALSQSTALGVGDYRRLAERAFRRLLSHCSPRRGIEFFSKGNYGLFTDRRSYPRNLAMILYHLALELETSVKSCDETVPFRVPVIHRGQP